VNRITKIVRRLLAGGVLAGLRYHALSSAVSSLDKAAKDMSARP
jgi:hypothetical protein